METQLIKERELKNDTQHVHLYRMKDSDVWVAYGYSAYSLRLCAKSLGYDNLRGFSTFMNLPYTMVSFREVKRLRRRVTIEHEDDNYVFLTTKKAFDKNEYLRWYHNCTEDSKEPVTLKVHTLVSEQVPKGVFIPDSMSAFARNTKRIIDCISALLAMIVFSPLALFCYIAIKMEDGGPAIFKQERIGRFGRPFNIYKFRSMRLDAEKFGPQLSHAGGDNDPRLTKIGKFIRAHHLDELPQLWNVFNGDMAFIGPRPERQFFIDQILEYDKRYVYLYQIRPGVTSYATLYNGYTDTMEKMLCRLEYDLYYLKKRSWWFDLKILFNTFCSIVFGKKF